MNPELDMEEGGVEESLHLDDVIDLVGQALQLVESQGMQLSVGDGPGRGGRLAGVDVRVARCLRVLLELLELTCGLAQVLLEVEDLSVGSGQRLRMLGAGNSLFPPELLDLGLGGLQLVCK